MSDIQTHQSSEKNENDVKIIELRGSLDSFNIKDVIEYIQKIVDNMNESVLVFDMSELHFITAQSIASFVNIVTKYNKEYNVSIMNMNNKIKEMFTLLGFDGCFNVINELSEIDDKKSLFPITITCPSCGNKMSFIKSGRFPCSSCKTTITVNKEGKIEE